MAETEPAPILRDVPEELTGERIVVRTYRAGDGMSLWDAVEESREHIVPWLPWGPHHRVPGDSEAFARRQYARWLLREEFSGSLWLRSDGRFLGGIGLHPQNWSVPSFEIGYWLRKSATGQGYMTEAVELMTRLAFETLEANRVFIRVAARNHHSAGVARRAGYIQEGALRNAERTAEGALYDMLFFGMTAEDYAAARRQ